jgi:hypothetical protein
MTTTELNAVISHHEEVLIVLYDLAKAKYKLNYEQTQLENALNFNSLVAGMHKTRVENAQKVVTKLENKYQKLIQSASDYVVESIKLQENLS